MEAAHEDLQDDAFRRNAPAIPQDYDRAVARYGLSDDEAGDLLRVAIASGAMVAPSEEVDDAFVPALSAERVDAIRTGELVPEALDLFFDRASKYPLLTASEERRLAQTIETGLSAASRDLADPETAALVRRGQEAKDKFVCSNIRLVISIAKLRRGQGIEFPDLIQYGILGLNRAVEKFDWRRGLKFSTYATWWIRQSIDRALADYGRLIRIPVHQVEKLRRVQAARSRLRAEIGRDPDVHEIATAVGRSPEEVAFLLDTAREPLWLDAPSPDGTMTIGEVIASSEPPLHEIAERSDRKHRVHTALAQLSSRERTILEMRYGLDDGSEKTLDSVGRRFNVTRERIRQIEKEAKKHLRPLLIEAGVDREPAALSGAPSDATDN